MDQGKYRVEIDQIRMIAMLMVVVLHTFLSFTLRPDFFNTKLWWVLEPIVALSRTSVLLFFILSGYLALNKNYSIRAVFNKIFTRLFVPFFCFETLTIGYMYYRFGSGYPHLGDFIWSQVNRLSGAIFSPLWFLVVLIFLYFCIPLIQVLFSSPKNRSVVLYLLYAAFTYSVVSNIVSYILNKVDSFYNSFTYWPSYFCLFLYGACIRQRWITVNKKVSVILLCIAMSATITGDFIGGQDRLVFHNQNVPVYTQSYLSLPVLLTALCLFNLLIQTSLYHKSWNQLCLFGAKVSFGIYLFHPFVVSFFSDIIQFDFDHLSMNVYLYNILNYCLVLTVSCVFTLLIKSIPYVKRIIGDQ